MTHAQLFIFTDFEARDHFVAAEITKYQIHATDVVHFSETSIGIAQIRALKQRIAQKPFASAFTLVILPAQALTMEAQQALLKTIEEPPPQTKLIIVSPKKDYLLPTIQSRVSIKYQTKQDVTKPALPDETKWRELYTSSIGQRLQTAADFPSDRAELISWLTESLKYFRHELLQITQNKSASDTFTVVQLLTLIRAISNTISLLHANVGVKLALDFLMINAPITD